LPRGIVPESAARRDDQIGTDEEVTPESRGGFVGTGEEHLPAGFELLRRP
jgi:hypothetical protein